MRVIKPVFFFKKKEVKEPVDFNGVYICILTYFHFRKQNESKLLHFNTSFFFGGLEFREWSLINMHGLYGKPKLKARIHK